MARISKAAVANAPIQPLRVEAAADLTAARPTANPAQVVIPLLHLCSGAEARHLLKNWFNVKDDEDKLLEEYTGISARRHFATDIER